MKFSQRMGFTQPPRELKLDEMTPDLRNSLWNETLGWREWRVNEGKIYYSIWKNFLKQPVDQMRVREGFRGIDYSYVRQDLRDEFFVWPAFKVYDFLEFLVAYNEYNGTLDDAINEVLETERSPYRVIAKKIVPITNAQEKDAVEAAVVSHQYAGEHIKIALSHLSNRPNPDYRNSIKESISAVESAAGVITGEKDTLGKLLKILETKHQLPNTLKIAFDKLYGYTSDENGLRHGLFGDSKVDAADARFFLVICSAFVNYLMSKYKPH